MMPLPADDWDGWSPKELSARLGPQTTDWYIVGGWALDLWLGRKTRPHDDLEIAVLPERIDQYRYFLPELEFYDARSGTLTHLPRTAPAPDDAWQLWGADMAARRWRLDIMLERGSPDTWVYKRHPSLRLPRPTAVRQNTFGIRYLAPTLVLLFKAKHCREKDLQDFQVALPHLQPKERADLRIWLEELHPNHNWIAELR